MNVYENPVFQKLTGGILRPGGLALTGEALALCAVPPGGKILDIGCGMGQSLKLFQEHGFIPYGCDISFSLAGNARAFGSAMQADALWLPLQAQCMDAVFLECVFSLLPDKQQALRECHRVLKPGGKLVLADLYRKNAPVAPTSVQCCSGGSMPVDARQKQPGNERESAASVTNCPEGAVPLPDLRLLLQGAGFYMLHEKDHSRALGELAARMIWELGSAEALYSLLQGKGQPGENYSCGSMRRKHGYIQLIAGVAEPTN